MTHSRRRMALTAAVLCAAAALPAAGEGPDALRALRGYKDGDPQAVLRAAELAVARATGDAAARAAAADALAAVAADPKASMAARRFACGQLALVASGKHVGILERLLGERQLADAARRALAQIPAPAATEALRGALRTLHGAALVGAIGSVGDGRDAGAVGTLAGLLERREPGVAAAAAKALGKIGTPAAAEVLGRDAPAVGPAALADARLRCAEWLLAAGRADTAEGLYRRVYTSKPAGPWRAAALAGLAAAGGERALPVLLKAAASQDAALRAAAVRATRAVRGAKATAALAAALKDLPPATQAMLIDALAERADRAAGPAVAGLLGAKDPAVRAAAIRAMATLGNASAVASLLAAAAGPDAAAQAAARASLARMAAGGVDEALLAAARRGPATVRVEAIEAIRARRWPGAEPTLMELAGDAEAAVSAAALNALADVGTARCYRVVVARVSAGPAAVARAAERAALAVGRRLGSPAERTGPLLAALKQAPAKAKEPLFGLLAAAGGPEALAAVRAGAAEADPVVADGAVRALAAWPDASAAEDLLRIARSASSRVHRTLALRGYLRLARSAADEAERLKMLDAVRGIATTPDDKRLLLSALGAVADPAALDLAIELSGEKAVHREAVAAAVRIGRALLATDRPAVRTRMEKLAPKVTDEALAGQVRAVLAESRKRPRRRGGGGSGVGLAPDKARSEAARKALAGRAPEGFRLVCYLDCGPDDSDGTTGGPTLRTVGGSKYSWAGAERVNVRHGTIRFDAAAVRFELTGLSARRTYRLGFTWWDYDHDDRVESVWATAGSPPRKVQLLKATRLPSYAVGRHGATEVTVGLPRELTAAGRIEVAFVREGGANAVVSEVWLWESTAESAPPKAAPGGSKAAPGAVGKKAPPAPRAAKGRAAATLSPPRVTEPRAVRPGKKGSKRVLIVTGNDYPGHKWRQTTPVLAAGLDKDPRLAVEYVETGDFLASPHLGDYDAIVLHWMNWRTPDPGEKARENLAGFVRRGGGLVLVHFACGAFQGWSEFARLAGRAWNPKLRGHDPRGPFRVNIDDREHPVTRGMKPFETFDELYTCLDGNAPIHVLASAVSKVDHKTYPMAFVLTYGRGRVFHCPLGHDVRAFEAPGVLELFRRGTAWAAGLEPVPAGKQPPRD